VVDVCAFSLFPLHMKTDQIIPRILV